MRHRPCETASRAHPRSRGENLAATRRERLGGGSSPLTRGKLDKPLTPAQASGLIPAHAGKTLAFCAGARSGWAHPRSRGENPSSLREGAALLGSSPLTRGKLSARAASVMVIGLIPAHAGKTQAAQEGEVRRAAHPRSRGENKAASIAGPRRGGSSPLTRGKRQTRQSRKSRRGLIPAHAGKTDARAWDSHRQRAHPRSRGENRRRTRRL